MKRIVLFFLIVFLCCPALTSTAEAGTYTIINNNDSGAGSLRQAVIDANAVAGAHTLSFNGAIGTITLLSALPNLTKDVTFDLSAAVGTVVLTGNSSGSGEQVNFDDGTFNFDGGSSVFTLTGSDTLYVGLFGTGTLNITNGGAVSNTNSRIGTMGTGTVTVDGANSTWTNSGDLNVGQSGIATLNITNGGAVSNTTGSVSSSGGTCSVTVDGANSTWTNSGTLSIGSSGPATLNITDGGAVSNTTASIGIYNTGTVTVDGANSTWTNSGDLTVGGGSMGGSVGTGTLNIRDSAVVSAGSGTGTITLSNYATATGTLNIGSGLTAGTLNAATVTGGDGTATVNFNHNEAAYTFAPILAGSLSVNQTGTGLTSLTGTNTYTGTTTITDGELRIGSGGTTGTLGTGAVTNNAALLFNRSNDLTVSNAISGTGTLEKQGAGILTLTGTNTYTGLTTVSAGTLAYGADNVISTGGLTVSGGTLDIGSYSDTLGTVTLSSGTITGTTGILSSTGTFEMQDGTVSAILGGGVALNKTTAGTITLSGANTYSGGTTISTGTLQIGTGATTALGTGAVVNNATLDIGANTLNVTGGYTQNNNSKLKVTVSGTSTAGRISSASAAAVSAASEVDVTVTDNIYIPNKAAFKVIDGAAGTGVNTPGTITSSNPRVRFTALGSNGDLILTADRSGIGFSSLALNSNAAAAGGVLDNISTPSGDMTNILNTLEGLSNSQAALALETVTPLVDNGVTAISNNALNRFTGTATDRLEGLVIQARNEGTGRTGVSTGSRGPEGFEAWGKGFGKYIHQKPRGASNGYRAAIWGTALGGDIPAFNNSLRLGLSGGYAQSGINSKDNSGRTDIDSYSSMLYGGYIDDTKPYYINGAFSFAYNTYEGSRQIAVGTIMRSANSDYDGRQYSALVDGGYTFKLKKLRLTPITSLQYTRLHLKEYTETGAGALNLNVRSQDYDMLQSGLGLKLERPFKIKSGTIVSEARFKWLYDFIGDRQETTATFSGGGGSFATEGFDPARNSFDMGTKLSLMTEGGWSFEVNYDFQYKEDFRAHAGWAGSRYRF